MESPLAVIGHFLPCHVSASDIFASEINSPYLSANLTRKCTFIQRLFKQTRKRAYSSDNVKILNGFQPLAIERLRKR